MTPAELAHVHASTCPVRLRRKYAEGERAHRGGGLLWAALLREVDVGGLVPGGCRRGHLRSAAMSPHPVPPDHVHLFHPGVAAAGKAAREADPPRSFLVGCAVCGESVQLGSDEALPRVPWKGPAIPWPALQPGFRRS